MVDHIRQQQYRDERAGLRFDDLHARTRDHDPGLAQLLVRAVSWPIVKLVWRMRHDGVEHIPRTGAVIIAANHASLLDHFFLGLAIHRPENFIAKSQLFTRVTRTPLNLVGAFPVRRGSHDDEAFITSLAVLRRGGVLVTYPQGGRARGSVLGDRPRSGAGRLALETGAPIIPAAIIGSAHVREWRRGHFPQITARFGAAIPGRYEPGASHERHQAIADEVMARISALYDGDRARA